MTLKPEIETEVRKVFDHVIKQGYNLTVYPLEHQAVMNSHDIEALVQAASHDVWNLVQVYRSRTLVGTFVLDVDAANAGDKLVSTATRSLEGLFKDF